MTAPAIVAIAAGVYATVLILTIALCRSAATYSSDSTGPLFTPGQVAHELCDVEATS